MLNEKQKKAWDKYIFEYSLGANAVWATFKGDKLTGQSSTACFASIFREVHKGCDVVVSRVQVFKDPIKDDSRYDDIKYFYEWLLGESPFAKVFLTKSVDEVLESRTLVVDANMPSNLAIGALSCARTIGEHVNILNTFVDLSKGGCNKNLAYVLATGAENAQRDSVDISWKYQWNGHKPFSPDDFDGKSLSNWLKGKAVNLNKSIKKDPNYQSDYYISTLWGGANGSTLNNLLRKYEASDWVVVSGKVKAVDLNPFRKDKVVPKKDGMSYADGITAMVNFSKQIEEKFCA